MAKSFGVNSFLVKRVFLVLAALALVMSACGTDEDADTSTDIKGDVANTDAVADTTTEDIGAEDTTAEDLGGDVAQDTSGTDAVDEDLQTADVGADAVDMAIEPDVAPAGPTWTDPVSEFFVSFCVECHTASPKDFTNYDEVIKFEESIRCGVSAVKEEGCGSFPGPKQFPVGNGPKPTDEQRQMIVDWVNAGMPEAP